jgi:uncharacterized protein YodC (DUF2158 family)
MTAGDIVYLKSGGPPMTVVSEGPDGYINVVHMYGGRKVPNTFPKVCLTEKKPHEQD